MAKITIFQRRSKPLVVQEVVLDVPDQLFSKVVTYIYKVGGVETEPNCYRVMSPFLETVVKQIQNMGNIQISSKQSYRVK